MLIPTKKFESKINLFLRDDNYLIRSPNHEIYLQQVKKLYTISI